jgi:hypothetical protein
VLENANSNNQQPPAKKPAYRVLEDPFEQTGSGDNFYGQTSTVSSEISNLSPLHNSTSGSKQPSYKVLEAADPMITSIYEPSPNSLSQ